VRIVAWEMFITCPHEEDRNSESFMQWKSYEKVLQGKTKAGKDNRLSVMQQKHPASDSNFCNFNSSGRALHII
jgi:hypothetical protein